LHVLNLWNAALGLFRAGSIASEILHSIGFSERCEPSISIGRCCFGGRIDDLAGAEPEPSDLLWRLLETLHNELPDNGFRVWMASLWISQPQDVARRGATDPSTASSGSYLVGEYTPFAACSVQDFPIESSQVDFDCSRNVLDTEKRRLRLSHPMPAAMAREPVTDVVSGLR
jgi:hypothetical protein